MNCVYISSVSLHVNEPYQILDSLRKSILCGYNNVTFFCGGCLICLIVLVVKLQTGFEAFGPPVKELESVLSFWLEPPLFRYLKMYGLPLFSEQFSHDVFKRYLIPTFCADN